MGLAPLARLVVAQNPDLFGWRIRRIPKFETGHNLILASKPLPFFKESWFSPPLWKSYKATKSWGSSSLAAIRRFSREVQRTEPSREKPPPAEPSRIPPPLPDSSGGMSGRGRECFTVPSATEKKTNGLNFGWESFSRLVREKKKGGHYGNNEEKGKIMASFLSFCLPEDSLTSN